MTGPGQLFPTKVRMALLAAIKSGEVRRDVHASFIRYQTDAGSNVTARVAEVIRAGWAEDVDKTLRLTDAGRAELEGHRR